MQTLSLVQFGIDNITSWASNITNNPCDISSLTHSQITSAANFIDLFIK